jgi:hypothetical protein
MPEQESQREGKDHRTVIAREGVIRRVVQEGIADVIDKRTIVRERMAQNVADRTLTPSAIATLITSWRCAFTWLRGPTARGSRPAQARY